MKTDPNRVYAVLTGDVVRSSALSVPLRRKLATALRSLGSELAGWPEVHPTMSRFRGDGWQLLVLDPSRSLRVALYIRASLRMRFEGQKLDTRVGIGIGRVDFVPGRRVAEGDGSAYRLSGAALDRKGWRRLVFGGIDRGDTSKERLGLERDVQVVLDLLDTIAREWTPSQARAIVETLKGRTQQEVASRWEGGSITQQAVAQHLSRSSWDSVQSALEWYEWKIRG